MKRLSAAGLALTLLSLLAPRSGALAQSAGTAFTYQGQLRVNGVAYTGTCDFTFSLWTALGAGSPPVGGIQVGGNVVKTNVAVANGLFTTSVDFGVGAFQGDGRWLQIAPTCPPGGVATALAPRQSVAPAPYALALPGLITRTGGASPNVIGGHTENGVGGSAGATIAGGGSAGIANEVTDSYGAVGGGRGNQAGDGAGTASDAESATVAGGRLNRAGGAYSSVGGGYGNFVWADYATIAGGGRSDPASLATGNRVSDAYGTVGGGGNNQAGDGDADPGNRAFATVGGGESNTASGDASTVGGGYDNTASGLNATVGGGHSNTASGLSATVGGGNSNAATALGNPTVGGGIGNTASGSNSTVAGGGGNSATGDRTAIGGGINNGAAGSNAVVGGGSGNHADGSSATVPGGEDNSAASSYSFAAGRRAKANHTGAFVWADSQDFDFASASSNSFRVRATGGGVRFVLGIDGTGAMTWSCLANDGSSWSCSSDRNQKENLEEVDGADVLARVTRLPVYRWNGKGSDPAVRHMGPTSQDFRAAFGLGNDDKLISTIDLDGVALAAIQGLARRLEESHDAVALLVRENRRLEERLAALERVARLDAPDVRP